MPAPTNPDQTEAQSPDDRLVTEAEALCGAISDMGFVPAVNLENNAIYVRLFHDVDVKPGALDLLKIITERAFLGPGFRDDVIAAVSHLGDYLADAPGINASLTTGPALHVIQALGQSGLLVRHHYERNDEQTPMLSFMPIPGQPCAPNAHLLMMLAVNRFGLEPEFAADMTRYIVNAGRSQHNA